MTRVKSILVPVDFSECCMSALQHASVWASQFGAHIDLLHVWEPPSLAPAGDTTSPMDDPKFIELVQSRAEQAMRSFGEQARAHGLAFRTSYCEVGSPALRIVERARSGKYDLIVMGTSGRTGLSRLMMGSVAERVVRLASCPVVTVRYPAAPASI